MNLGLLYRQGDDIRETSTADLADLCARLGASIVCPKAADGDSWEGEFDTDPILKIVDADALSRQRDAYAARGMSLHPWVVPRGLSGAIVEASRHAEIARICGTVVVDFEYLYAGFFGRRRDGTPIFGSNVAAMDWARSYFAELREMAPGRQIVLCVDHRQPLRGEYDAPALAPLCDAVSPQVYWTDFERAPIGVLDEAGAVDFGGLPFRPMLPANSTPADTRLALDHLAETLGERPPTVYIFQRTSLNAANVDVFARFGAPAAQPIN